MSTKYWLMKAEPDSRVVKGKDVKFSVDDFESDKTTAWEGVRNHEAKNLMKEMQVGDKVLFYHSNCKTPGIAAFAEVSKEAYPDYTAWDPKHPYYDDKTDQENPRWFMVDVSFISRAEHFIPLALLRYIADSSFSEPPSEIEYIKNKGIEAIKEMALVNRGRLSVQRVTQQTWEVIELMASKGGWDDLNFGKNKAKVTKRDGASGSKEVNKSGRAKSKNKAVAEDEGDDGEPKDVLVKPSTAGVKRKAADKEQDSDESTPRRRSTRARK